MALRKSQPVAEPLVRIAEVMVEFAGDGSAPDTWQVQAEQVAEGMRAAVVRDWRGQPCLSWTDAERLLLRLRRDREQANRERAAEQAAEEAQRFMLPFGCVQIERPGEPTWTSPAMVGRRDSDAHGQVEVPG